jgi:hypothetical protein
MGRRRVGVDLIGRVDAKQTAGEGKRSSARPEADTLRAAQIAETRAHGLGCRMTRLLMQIAPAAGTGPGVRPPAIGLSPTR